MKISNKFQAISKLTTRYKLVEGVAKPLSINDEYIQPITNADDLIKQPTIKRTTAVAHTGTGGLNIFTIPDGKRYTIMWMTIQTGNATVDSVFAAKDSTLTDYIQLNTVTAAATVHVTMNQPLIMDAGAILRVNIATRAGAGNCQAEIQYIEEDVY